MSRLVCVYKKNKTDVSCKHVMIYENHSTPASVMVFPGSITHQRGDEIQRIRKQICITNLPSNVKYKAFSMTHL